ncbi:MAG: cation:proton antiporter [Candidatus Nanohalobium sp.]
MVLEQLLVAGLSVIILPPLMEKIGINVRAGEVITGILLTFFASGLVTGQWLSYLAEIGLIVLMFEIGLDIDLEEVKDTFRQSMVYGGLSFGVPFILTLFAGLYFFGDLMQSFVVASGLSASSLAVVSPFIREKDVEASILENVVMISEALGVTFLVAFVKGQETSAISLPVQAATIVGFVLFLVFVLPRIVDKLKMLHVKDIIEFETKLILFLVVLMALISEELGIHAATGAFLTGIFFSETTHRGFELEDRLEPVLELFTPLFFLHIGTMIAPSTVTVDLILLSAGLATLIYVARFLSFGLASRITEGDFHPEYVSLLAPSITISATAASIGMDTGVLTQEIFSGLIFAGLFLTVIGPLGFDWLKKLD